MKVTVFILKSLIFKFFLLNGGNELPCVSITYFNVEFVYLQQQSLFTMNKSSFNYSIYAYFWGGLLSLKVKDD